MMTGRVDDARMLVPAAARRGGPSHSAPNSPVPALDTPSALFDRERGAARDVADVAIAVG